MDICTAIRANLLSPPVGFVALGSALWVAVVSLLTRPPSRPTIDKFFPVSKSTLLPST